MQTVDLTSSPFLPIARQVVTKLLVALGTWLVTRGYLDAASVNPLADEVTGTLVALAAASYATYQAKRKNTKAVLAATTVPGDGVEVKVDGKVVSQP